jgi:hypothetical protein
LDHLFAIISVPQIGDQQHKDLGVAIKAMMGRNSHKITDFMSHADSNALITLSVESMGQSVKLPGQAGWMTSHHAHVAFSFQHR